MRVLTALAAALVVIGGAQVAAADDDPNSVQNSQQFSVTRIPTPLRAQIGLPAKAGTSDVYKVRKVDLNPASSTPQVTYGRSQELKDNATLNELVTKAVCVWNEALGTPCDSATSFLVEGVQSFPSGSRAGIEMKVGKPEDLGWASGFGGSSCTADECKGSLTLSSRLKNDVEGVRTVVHEIGHTFDLDHAIENDSFELSRSGDGTRYYVGRVRLWMDCQAIMAYRGANCRGTTLTDAVPTFYETECVKSLYGLPAGRTGTYCQGTPEIGRTTFAADKSVNVTVRYRCDDTDLRTLEVSVLQPGVPPNRVKGKASAPLTCDGKEQNQTVSVKAAVSEFGTGKSAFTAHLVDISGKVKGNARPSERDTIPTAG